MLEKIWNDSVWSKVIAIGICSLPAVISSGFSTYFISQNTDTFFSVLLNTDIKLNLFVILFLLFLLLTILIVIIYKNSFFKYDVFLSAPMSGFDDESEYQDFRKLCLETVEHLKNECGYKKIYYAGGEKDGKKKFSTPKVAFNQDLKALKNSKRFLLLHPKKLSTSTLFEAGYALRKGTKSVYIVRDIKELPFLMRHLNDASEIVSIICVSDIKNALSTIKNDRAAIFE